LRGDHDENHKSPIPVQWQYILKHKKPSPCNPSWHLHE